MGGPAIREQCGWPEVNTSVASPFPTRDSHCRKLCSYEGERFNLLY